MPNAATHLAAAHQLLNHPNLKPLLASQEPQAAFLLGAISPDVQAISGSTREETHFYTIPPSDAISATSTMFEAYPSLADSQTLQPAHAAFIAGYMSHLIMDEVWLAVVVMPHIYIDGAQWGRMHPNFRAYSCLIVYQERQNVERLNSGVHKLLARAEPDNWLPFIYDHHLRTWRDHVVEQLTLGGAMLVMRFFAEMNGMAIAEMAAITSSEEQIAEEVYPTVPKACLETFHQSTYARSIEAVDAYLNNKSQEEL